MKNFLEWLALVATVLGILSAFVAGAWYLWQDATPAWGAILFMLAIVVVASPAFSIVLYQEHVDRQRRHRKEFPKGGDRRG